MSKIKIGDTVCYSPSLMPLVGEVVGIMGNYVTIRSEDDIIIGKDLSDCESCVEDMTKDV